MKLWCKTDIYGLIFVSCMYGVLGIGYIGLR
jgi:hypothetical protein